LVPLQQHLLAQQHQKPVTSPGSPISKTQTGSPVEQLQMLYDAERAAARSGSPAEVEEASQQLAAMALREMAAIEVIERQYDDSIAHYKRSLTLEDAPSARSRLAMVYLAAEKPDEAIAEVDKVLQANPKDAGAWFTKGKAAVQKGDSPQAITAFTKSLELKSNPDVQFALANAFLELKQKENAERVFQTMLSQYGDRAIWHMVFAGGYRDHGYRDDAIREFKRAIQLDPKLPHLHLFLALTILERDTWEPTEAAISELEEAIRLEPKDYLANQYLGAIESKQGKFADSDKHLKIASEADPTSPDPWVFLGSNAYQNKQFDLAKQYLTKAVALTGKDEARNNYQIRKAYIILGRLSITEGKREEGQRQLEHSKQLFALYMKQVERQIGGKGAAVSGMGGGDSFGGDLPGIVAPPKSAIGSPAAGSADDAQAEKPKLSPEEQSAIANREKQLRAILGVSFNDWGTSEARQKNYAVAMELFKEAKSWDPQTPGLMRNLGIAAFRQEDYPEAASALRVAVSAEPQVLSLRAMLAMALFNTNSFTEAAQAFSPMRDNAFSDPRLAYAWAISLIKTNQYQPASNILEKLQAQQSSTDTLLLIAQAWNEMGYYPQAAVACHKALQIDPQLQHAHFLAGSAYMRLEKYDDAVNEFRAEMALSPGDVENEYSLAYVLLRQSKTDEAIVHLKAVLNEAPDHPGANYQLGKALLDGGQIKEAITYLEAAARLSPGLDYVHYQLQMAYRKDDRREDADRELAIYKQIKAEKRESSVRRLEENSKKADSPDPN
jgi:tetratricopeptide (TPR) repeat protein